MTDRPTAQCERRIGRYEMFGELASGGMGAVHFGRLVGEQGFARVVAIKRLHEHVAKLPDFAKMFLDEGRLAARIRHPNVVATLDALAEGGELLLVMEYVAGESLAGLRRAAAKRGRRIPIAVAVRVAADALYGLHAAHAANGPDGEPLGIVHRDVSPQNVLVGTDGLARVLDFGIAKATSVAQTTRSGGLKGKIRYMAPEQLREEPVTPRTDVYALSVVLWELLTGEQLFEAANEPASMAKVLAGVVVPPTRLAPDVPDALSEIVLRGLSRDPESRFASADEMARALERATSPALPREVGDWVRDVAAEAVEARAHYVAAMERASGVPTLTGRHLLPPRAVNDELVTETAGAAPAMARAPAEERVVGRGLRDEPRRRGVIALLGVMGAVGLVVVSVLIVTRHRASADSTRASSGERAESGESASSAESAGPPTPMLEAAGAAVASATPSSIATTPTAPAAPTDTPVSPPPPRGVATGRRAPPTRSAAPVGRPTRRPNCNPPYEEDARGVRHIKDGCL